MPADIVLKKGDRRPFLQSILSDANGDVDLTGASVRFLMSNDVTDPTTGDLVLELSTTDAAPAVSVTGATSGAVQMQWPSTGVDTEGHFIAEWEVTFADGRQATFPNNGFLSVIIWSQLGGSA